MEIPENIDAQSLDEISSLVAKAKGWKLLTQELKDKDKKISELELRLSSKEN
jgi:hypothetical protein